MSFFSTADIRKSLIFGESVESIVSSNEFKVAMGTVDIEKYISKELMEQLIKKILTNPDVKKQIRKMLVKIIFEMKEDGVSIVIINRDDCE